MSIVWAQKRTGKGFTLVELLVVVAIIALLLSILLPSLASARESSKSAKCLASLKDMASASHTYAASDQTENLVPMHWRGTVDTPYGKGIVPGSGGCYYLIGDRQWGGKGGDPRLFDSSQTSQCGNTWAFTQVWEFGPADRPLNQIMFKGLQNGGGLAPPQNIPANWNWNNINTPYLEGAIADTRANLDVFRCPSDVGWASNRGGEYYLDQGYVRIDRGIHLDVSQYDFFGNSYYSPFHWAAGNSPPNFPQGFYSTTAYANQTSNIYNPSRLALYYEGNMEDTVFWNRPDKQSDVGGGPNGLAQWWSQGWHQPQGEIMEFNSAFCDGHAGKIDAKVRSAFSSLNASDATGDSFISGTLAIRGSRPEVVDPPAGWNANAGNVGWWGDKMYRGEGWTMDNLPAVPKYVYRP